MDLIQRSVDIILQDQSPSGAYVACPNFPTYQYCWFRDGSFIAYAMDRAGERDSAARFHEWAARAINSRSNLIDQAVARCSRGETLPPEFVLHTRYTLDGEVGIREEWPNFQLDGFGTWLWALEQHQLIWGDTLPETWLLAAQRVAGYLTALWNHPCYDCWEEDPDHVHPHTLAAIYAGLAANDRLVLGEDHTSILDSIRAYIQERNQGNGHFVKFPGREMVDASLLGLAVPYGVFPLTDPRIAATVEKIEKTLRIDGGGVHRYPADTYYGGGEWILLTAWLGWYYAQAGLLDQARALLSWCFNQAGVDGSLPEQVAAHLIDPAYLGIWEQRWGISANPLLWSHAMVIVLHKEIECRE